MVTDAAAGTAATKAGAAAAGAGGDGGDAARGCGLFAKVVQKRIAHLIESAQTKVALQI